MSTSLVAAILALQSAGNPDSHPHKPGYMPFETALALTESLKEHVSTIFSAYQDYVHSDVMQSYRIQAKWSVNGILDMAVHVTTWDQDTQGPGAFSIAPPSEYEAGYMPVEELAKVLKKVWREQFSLRMDPITRQVYRPMFEYMIHCLRYVRSMCFDALPAELETEV